MEERPFTAVGGGGGGGAGGGGGFTSTVTITADVPSDALRDAAFEALHAALAALSALSIQARGVLTVNGAVRGGASTGITTLVVRSSSGE